MSNSLRPEAENNPIRDLGQIGSLLTVEAESTEAREAIDPLLPDQRKNIEEVIGQFSTVAGYTSWSNAQLLEYIGAENPKVFTPSEVTDDQLDNCQRFIGLLTEVCDRKATGELRRGAVMMLGKFALHIDRPARVIDELLDTRDYSEQGKLDGNDISPREYIMLGEEHTAARVARVNAGVPNRGDMVFSESPFADLPFGHLADTRLQIYLEDRVDLFGEDVFKLVHNHIGACDVCTKNTQYIYDHRIAAPSPDRPDFAEKAQKLIDEMS